MGVETEGPSLLPALAFCSCSLLELLEGKVRFHLSSNLALLIVPASQLVQDPGA